MDRRVWHWRNLKHRRDAAFCAEVGQLRESLGLPRAMKEWRHELPDDPLEYGLPLSDLQRKWDPYDARPVEFFAEGVCEFMNAPLIFMVHGHPTDEEIRQARAGQLPPSREAGVRQDVDRVFRGVYGFASEALNFGVTEAPAVPAQDGLTPSVAWRYLQQLVTCLFRRIDAAGGETPELFAVRRTLDLHNAGVGTDDELRDAVESRARELLARCDATEALSVQYQAALDQVASLCGGDGVSLPPVTHTRRHYSKTGATTMAAEVTADKSEIIALLQPVNLLGRRHRNSVADVRAINTSVATAVGAAANPLFALQQRLWQSASELQRAWAGFGCFADQRRAEPGRLEGHPWRYPAPPHFASLRKYVATAMALFREDYGERRGALAGEPLTPPPLDAPAQPEPAPSPQPTSDGDADADEAAPPLFRLETPRRLIWTDADGNDHQCDGLTDLEIELCKFFTDREFARVDEVMSRRGPVTAWRAKYTAEARGRIKTRLSALGVKLGDHGIPIRFELDGDLIVRVFPAG
jgi:hypothetical protein